MSSEKAGLVIRLEKLATLVLLGVAVIALAAAHVLAWRWASEPFLGMLLGPTLVLSPFEGKDWARLQFDPPLEQPDRLIAIDGQTVHQYGDVAAILHKREVGQEVTATTVREGSSPREITITLTVFPLRDMVLLFLLPYLAGLIYLGIGIWVYWVQDWDRIGQIFASMCAFVALAIGLSFEMDTTHQLSILLCVSVPFAAATAVHLALVFPQQARFIQRAPLLCVLPYLPAIFLTTRSALSIYDINHPWDYIGHFRDSYLFAGLSVLFLLMVLFYRLVKSSSPLFRQQSRIILLGASLAFLPAIPWILLTLQSQLISFPIWPYALLSTLFPLSIAYTILRYRLLDVDQLLSRGIAYGVLTFLVIATYSLAVNGLSRFFAVQASDPILLAVFVLVLTLSFNQLRNWIQRLVDRIFIRPKVDYRTWSDPYVVGDVVQNPQQFYGREEALNELLRAIWAGNHVAICGERRIGKTSLLYQLAHRLEHLPHRSTYFLPVFVNLQMVPAPLFFRALTDAITKIGLRQLERDKHEIPRLRRGQRSREYDSLDLADDLEVIIEALQTMTDKTPCFVLLLDEADKMNVYDPQVQEALRGLLMTPIGNHIKLVWSGKVMNREWHLESSPWYNLFKQEILVGSLEREAAARLVREPVKGVFAYKEKAVQRVLELTDRKPFSIQRLCSFCVRRLLREESFLVTVDDVDAAYMDLQAEDARWAAETGYNPEEKEL